MTSLRTTPTSVTTALTTVLTRALATLAGSLLAATAAAQHSPAAHPWAGHGPQAHPHGAAAAAHDKRSAHSHSHGTHSAYAGLTARTIKALSAQDEANLRGGKGMSLALPAELNGYPGPSHVLELAEPLALSPAQRSRTQALFEQMQAKAQAAGEEVIAAEAALDALFKNRQATDALLTEATARAGEAWARVRETHLRYHLRMMEVLSPEQVAQYNRLRGY